ncbi:DUF2804 domain-containing protein [Microbacterium candidum]|uniref:DUF2804 domain-containing protein n=1 Tax=Microbacterium candidum TaxID=3041922 RepID=A0ABT7MWP9_9MICO|nr:DUF2804 domain-containing protein [Microbacterium sp. ASV49]MDL9978880.1 DUF2804 domain-containing protein [Microbacterium sp. ASV49]
MTERELTSDVPLTLPNGRLNRAAVGFARHPLVDTGGIPAGWGRNKRWEYWNVLTPTHIVALTVSSIDYAAVHEVWVFDRATERTWSKNATVIPPKGVELPPRLDAGPARARAKGLAIDITPGGDPSTSSGTGIGSGTGMGSGAGMGSGTAAGSGAGDGSGTAAGLGTAAGSGAGGASRTTRLRAEIADASFDITVTRPAGHECLAVVVPWSDTRYQYTVKDVALPASGTVTVDGTVHDVTGWATLDHGRGRWPYDVSWNWGAGAGISDGRTIGIQVGGQWTDGTGSTENGIVIDGRLHKIHDELRWTYDIANWRKPWRISGGGLDASFTPFYDKRSATNLGVVSSRTDQCFGVWSGRFEPAGVEFDGIEGFAEDVHNRW